MTVWQAMHALEGLGYRFRATGGGVKAEICGEAPPESSALLDIVRSDREAARAYVVEREAGAVVEDDGCTFSLFDALAIGQAVRRGEARLIGKVIFHRQPMTATIHCEDLSALPVWRERLKKALEARLQAMEGRGWENSRRRNTPVSAKNTGNIQGFWRGLTMNSKRKGNGGERELLSILQAVGVAERNDQRYTGGVDNPDISFTLGGRRFHVECKRAERFNAYAAMEQAEHDANGHAVPVVMHRRNRAPWLVVMKLSDWVKLYEK